VKKKSKPVISDDDALLLQRLKSQDSQAFRDFYQTYSPFLLRKLVLMTGSISQAEDCLQQTFIKAYKNINAFRGEGSLRGWLVQIATRNVMDLFRKEQKIQALKERFWPHRETVLQQSIPVPDTLFFQEETKDMIRAILETLSPQKRMAILLCDLEGLSLEEAAAQLEVPPGTIGSRLYHGRREFQKRFAAKCQQQGITPGDLFYE